MFCFRKSYFNWTLALFVIEIIIAVFIRDQYIRPYGGDVLVVILVYCFLRTFIKVGVSGAAGTALLIAFAAELGQYLNLTHWLAIQDNEIASGFFGNSFDWTDLLCYCGGIIIVVFIEYFVTNNLRPAAKNSVAK